MITEQKGNEKFTHTHNEEQIECMHLSVWHFYFIFFPLESKFRWNTRRVNIYVYRYLCVHREHTPHRTRLRIDCNGNYIFFLLRRMRRGKTKTKIYTYRREHTLPSHTHRHTRKDTHYFNLLMSKWVIWKPKVSKTKETRQWAWMSES